MLDRIKKHLNMGDLIIPLLIFLVIFSVLIIISFSAVVYVRQYNVETNKFELLEEQRTDLLKDKIEAVSDLVISDLLIAKNHHEFFLYLDSLSGKISVGQGQNHKQNLIEELLVLAKSRRVYNQIRFIDLKGDELIRVNHQGSFTFETQDEDLQNKADRYYFKESIQLNENEIYVSALDLNIENGQIEEPIKPMIRIATPIFNNGEKIGVLVLNYFAQEILNIIEENIGVEGEKAFLVNEDGYWLKGPSQEDEWGFMYGDTSKTIYNWSNQLINNEIDLSIHQSVNDVGLFTIVAVNPFDFSEIIKDGSVFSSSPVSLIRKDSGSEWKLITFISKDNIHSETNRLLVFLVVANVTTILLLISAGTVLISALNTRKKSEIQIIKLNDTLKIITKVLRHDLANAFTHVNFSIELFDSSKDEKYLEEISTSAKHGISVIEQMKELEGMVNQGASLSNVSLKDTFEQIIDNYEIKINIEGLNRDKFVIADSGINSVFENIISNSIRHAKVREIDIKVSDNNNRVIVKFIDKGKGIPDSIKDKIFEDGFKYGETANTGLGLYIVQQTVKRYGGNVRVEDNNPKGTIFIVELKKSQDKKKL